MSHVTLYRLIIDIFQKDSHYRTERNFYFKICKLSISDIDDAYIELQMLSCITFVGFFPNKLYRVKCVSLRSMSHAISQCK